MSHLTYYAYPGVGQRNLKRYNYSQSVRVGDRIECAGQGVFIFPSIFSVPDDKFRKTNMHLGGWDPQTGEIPKDISAQIDQAFANVELNLKDAGGKGWEQVYRINSYHVPVNDEALEAMARSLRKNMPNHQPIWTCVGVTELAEEAMKVEIEVVAHDPEAK